jgi:hypothetical protein
VHYNADKAGVTSFQSYQWARVAFDGPQLPAPRAYSVPDSLSHVGSCKPEGTYHIAYGVTDGVAFDFNDGPGTPAKLTFSGVDPSGAVGARLNFNTTHVAAGDTLSIRFNKKAWRDHQVPAISTTWERQGFSLPVDVSDLVAGDNRVEFRTNSVALNMPPNSMHIANIDLEIELP